MSALGYSNPPQRAHNRRHVRHNRRLRVLVTVDGQTFAAISQNIGMGGIYLRTDERVPYGTDVELDIPLPSVNERAHVSATVRWHGPDGMGLQFHSLGAQVVWGLNRLFLFSPDD